MTVTHRVGSPKKKPRFALTGLLALTFCLIFVGVSGQAQAADPQSQGTVAALVRANPLAIGLALSQTAVSIGERFEIDVVVRNRGNSRLRDISIKLHILEEPCLKVLGSTSQHRGLLKDDGSLSKRWKIEVLRGGAACRNIFVLASVSAVDSIDGEVITLESDAKLLTIK